MAKKLKIPLERNCPNCNCLLEYWYKKTYQNAIENRSKCESCSQNGRKFTKEHRKKLSIAKLGNKNPNKRQENREKIRKSLTGHKRYLGKQKEWWIEKISKSKIGKKKKPYSEKAVENIRIAASNAWRNKYGQRFPNYNPKACKLIDEYGEKYGYNFQHAENGGEICIGGYFPDGIDGKKKAIIEIDESKHYDKNGILNLKDIKKQQYLEKIGYKVIRIRI